MSANKEMRVLYIEPGKYPKEITIPDTLKALQECVKGDIAICYPWSTDRACVVCNDAGKLNGMQPNRQYCKHDFLSGPFLVCGFRGENLIGLTDEQLSRYEELFHFPQILMDTPFGLYSIKCTPEQYAEHMGEKNMPNINEIEQERE